MEQFIHESKRGVVLAVHVVPRSSRDEVAGVHGRALRIRLNAPPVEGAANAALIAFVGETLEVPRRQVEIISGHASRHKLVLVSGMSREEVEEKLAKSPRT